MLSREQAIAAVTALVALASHERHVKTEAGAEYYHLPIGALIIAHPKIHTLREKHLKLVYAGGKPFGVPKDAKVWVSKLTDMHNDAEVAETGKIITIGKPGGYGIHQASGRQFSLMSDGSMADDGGLTQYGLSALETSHKQVPDSELKVPLKLGGKLRGWMPETYKAYVYEQDDKEDPSEALIYAKAPDGGWWAFMNDGNTQLSGVAEKILNDGIANGTLLKMEPMDVSATEHPPPHPEAAAGPADAKVTVGGIPVTAAELSDAIEILNNAKSTNVKLPLKHAGHKLQHMDYMGVSKQELKNHPELKVPKGTKQKHVGQVKIAVLHHMTEKLKGLGATNAQHGQAAQAGEQAEADAKQAQVMTPATIDIGNKMVSKEEIQTAVTMLQGEDKSITESLKDSPLSGMSSILITMAKAHVKESGHSPESIRDALIHVLQQKLGIVTMADVASGHEAASAHDNPTPPMKDLVAKVMEGAGQVPVYINGKKVDEVSAGSKIYKHASATIGTRWVRLPNGDWITFSDTGAPIGVNAGSKQAEIYEGSVKGGALVLENAADPLSHEVAIKKIAGLIHELSPQLSNWAAEPGATSDFSEALTAGAVTAAQGSGEGVWIGHLSGMLEQYHIFSESPHGAERWHVFPDGDVVHFGKDDAQGTHLSSSQVYDIMKSYADKSAHSKTVGAMDEDDLTELTPEQKTQELLKNGAIPPGKARKGKSANAIGYSLAQAAVDLAHPYIDNSGIGNRYVWQHASTGKWQITFGAPGSDIPEWYLVSRDSHDGSISAEHFTFNGGNSVPEDISSDVAEYVHPNAAMVMPQGSYEPKMFKYGHYYKPKGQSHLEIGPGDSGGAFAGSMSKFTYHAPGHSGSKEVGSAYAAKALANMTEYYEQPKEFAAPASKPKVAPAKTWASTLVPNVVPGTHTTAVEKPKYKISTGHDLAVYEDGSGSSYTSTSSMSLTSTEIQTLAMSGKILDQYGTTILVPGATPPEYHVFGSKAISPHEMGELLANWQTASDQNSMINQMSHLTADLDAKPSLAIDFTQAHDANTWKTQGDAITGLIANLVHGVSDSAALGAGQTEGAKFLKNMPAGITSPKDIFEFDEAGHADPIVIQGHYPSSFTTMPFYNLNNAELKNKVQLVSEKFGGGKVVGTHPASMSKDDKVIWLTAWTQGDMKTVFAIDAKAGKVSPAHPGAPENEDTHTISWAPFGKGEVPAANEVEGVWTSASLIPPIAEVANYLIKAGLNHAEMLSAQEWRQWMKAHRDHNQMTVDMISKIAQDRFDQHVAPLSEKPYWTEDVKPAKSYDAYLEDDTAVENWTSGATQEFLKDHLSELQEVAQQKIDSGDYFLYPNESVVDPESWGYANKFLVMQQYVDAKKAAELAERMKPVYELTPGGMSPVSSHPIYEIQDQFGNHFFFKPAPSSEKFLAEQEDAAAKIAHAWGFKTPDSRLIEFDGKFGQAQAKLNPDGDMTYGQALGFYEPAPVPWTELTQRQLSDIAREHVLDWALDNDDGRASNFLRMPDGSIVGIDKGRSWANYGHWNGLVGDERMDERSAQLVTQLYQAVRDHKFSKDTADQIYTDVIRKAQKMQRLSDEKLRLMMFEAVKSRTQFAGQHDSAEKLVQAAVDRKNGLADDFTKMWAGIYKDAGWQLPEIPEPKLPETRKGEPLYSGFGDPELLDHVNTVTVAGVPTFFGGAELEDSNILLWREFQGSGFGSPTLHGESGTHGSAYDKLVQWCSTHETEAPANAPAAPVDVANVYGEQAWYNGIIEAVKTISYHNQQGDKSYNQSRLDKMKDAQLAMQARLVNAEDAIAKGPDSSQYAAFTANYGSPELNQHAIKYYLDMTAQVDKAREDNTVFQPGTLPRWEAPEDLIKKPEEEKKEPSAVKVVLKSATRSHGVTMPNDEGLESPLDSDGNYHASTSALSYPGSTWHITLPTGEVIEFSNGPAKGIELAHRGRIRFTAVHQDGLVSLERIRSQLQDMGLEMKDADENDLQLFYWRHLTGSLSDRNDSTFGKYKKVWQVLLDKAKVIDPGSWNQYQDAGYLSQESLAPLLKMLEDGAMDPESELSLWHEAWSNATSPDQVQHFVESGGYLPHHSHFDLKHPDKAAGDPYWMRVDVSPVRALQESLPNHSYTGDTDNGALFTVRSGGTFGKEEQMRQVGASLGTMGNPYDSGATNYVYTRQNLESLSGWSLLFNPSVLARTTTYAFEDDEYGKTESRKYSAPFSFSSMTKFSDGSNEAMVKNGISILDGVEVIKAHAGEHQRQQIIKQLKALGIDEIRGVPVEQRVVTANVPSQQMDIIKAAMRKNQDDIDW